jgi:hypothetical protein
MSSQEPKSKEARLTETLTIINKMKELGLSEKEPGYVMTKQRLSEWVKTGEAWSGTIEFPYLQRKAELVLPYRADRVASMLLKAPFHARGRR